MIIPLGEWLPDLPGINHPGLVDIVDAIPLADGYKSMALAGAVSGAGDALSARCQGAFEALNGATPELYLGDASKLYRLVTLGAGEPDDVSKVGGYSTPAAGWWDFAQYGNILLAVNGGVTGANPPQAWTLGSSSAFADLAGSPPKASCIAVVRDFVVLGNTYDATDGTQTTRVRWSGFGDHTAWAINPATQADIQDLQIKGGPIQRIIGGAEGYIFQERSLTRMTYEGPPTVFRFDEVAPGIGTRAPRSVVQAGEAIYWLSNDGFVGLVGGQLVRIGANRVDEYVKRSITSANVGYVVGCHDEQNGIIWWVYGGDTTITTKKLIGYSYKVNRWTQASTAAFFIFASRISAANPTLGYQPSDLKVYTGVQDAHRIPYYTTGWRELFDGRNALVNKARPLWNIRSGSVALTVQARGFYGVMEGASIIPDESSTGVQQGASFNPGGDFQFRCQGRYIGWYINDDGYSGAWDIRGIDVTDARPVGRAR